MDSVLSAERRWIPRKTDEPEYVEEIRRLMDQCGLVRLNLVVDGDSLNKCKSSHRRSGKCYCSEPHKLDRDFNMIESDLRKIERKLIENPNCLVLCEQSMNYRDDISYIRNIMYLLQDSHLTTDQKDCVYKKNLRNISRLKVLIKNLKECLDSF